MSENIREHKFEAEPKVVINAVVIQDGKLLLVKKKDVWIFPGGKLESGESELECLNREIKEELSQNVEIDKSEYLETFEGGVAPHSGYEIIAKVYLAKISGQLVTDGKNDSISEMAWVDNFNDYYLSETTKNIINYLKKRGLLRQ